MKIKNLFYISLFLFCFQGTANDLSDEDLYYKLLKKSNPALEQLHKEMAIKYSYQMARLQDPSLEDSTLKQKEQTLKSLGIPLVLPTPKPFKRIAEMKNDSEYPLVQELLYEEDFTGHDLYRSIENSSRFNYEIKNICVDQIIRAKREIILETTSLSSPSIINALIKLKILRPKISIRILIKDHQEEKTVSLPDSAFFEENIYQ